MKMILIFSERHGLLPALLPWSRPPKGRAVACRRGHGLMSDGATATATAAEDDGATAPATAPAAEDDGATATAAEDNRYSTLNLCDALEDNILLLACLSCSDEGHERNRKACPCFATLHPFCDAFHSWLCHRLIDDGRVCCSLLPGDVLVGEAMSDDDASADARAAAAVTVAMSAAAAAADRERRRGNGALLAQAAAPAQAAEGDDACVCSDQASSDGHPSSSDSSEPASESEDEEGAEEEGPEEPVLSDPLTTQLRDLASTATALVSPGIEAMAPVPLVRPSRYEAHSTVLKTVPDMTHERPDAYIMHARTHA